MSIEFIAIFMIIAVILLLVTGAPLVFILGSVGATFLLLFEGFHSLQIPILSLWGLMGTFVFVAVPLFIFMGVMLQKAGIAEALFQMIYCWAGPVRGGLAMGVVGICVIFAAMCGTTGAATVSLGYIAIPPLLERGYDKRMVTGTIQAGGALGFLIPPSVVMVIYGMIARVSVGRLFASGVFPGLILACLFMIYIGIRCLIQKEMGPAMPKNERNYSLKQKLASTRAIILPAALILMVLGSITLGMASPTEAAAVGAVGSIAVSAIYRRLTLANFKEALLTTARIMGMVMWVAFAAVFFSVTFDYFGGTELVGNLLTSMKLGPWGILIVIQLSFLVLGCFMDDTAILFVCMPIYIPIIISQGFEPVWFGILYVINMQMAYLTPPFGYNLFYMKGITNDLYNTKTITERISMGDIYSSVIPFVALQAIGLALVMIFPQIALWLPDKIFG